MAMQRKILILQKMNRQKENEVLKNDNFIADQRLTKHEKDFYCNYFDTTTLCSLFK
jgi:hypothetical protein